MSSRITTPEFNFAAISPYPFTWVFIFPKPPAFSVTPSTAAAFAEAIEA